MSSTLIARSPDLTRLRNEGYNLEVRETFLLVKDVPYVNDNKEVLRGTLVTTLAQAGNATARPDTHVTYFIGERPCHKDGLPIDKIIISSQQTSLAPSLVVDHQFSAKPPEPDPDYYEKITRHIRILAGPARAILPGVTAQSFAPVAPDAEEASVFHYSDTASSRARIIEVQRKLEQQKVAIVGLGGTGSYVLDYIAKTPVLEIHNYDGDLFLQHNAFRGPGAPSLEVLEQKLPKVAYWGGVYSKMRRGIFPHEMYLDADSAHELRDMSFVFICIDSGPAKAGIIRTLIELGVSFVDVGMGVELIDGSLSGIVRATTVTRQKADHVSRRISTGAVEADNDYVTNIQIAELNAFNAFLAVMRWKKMLTFYADLENEHNTTYTISGNAIINSEIP